jgi:pimeloyl-ACP methyl ester carboxylesterase
MNHRDIQALARRIEWPTRMGMQVWHAWNESAGRPLILLHGGSGSWTHWVANVQALSEHRAVYALDLPGFGDSELPPEARDVDGLYPAVAEGIQSLLGPGPHEIMAFSFGGMTAGYMAADLPQLFYNMVLVGIPGLGLFGPQLALRGMREGMTQAEQREVLRHNLRIFMLYHDASITDDTVDMQAHNVARDRLRRRRIARGNVLIEKQTHWTCPVHTIWGQFDALYGDNLQHIPQALSHCQHVGFHIIPDAGHWVQYDRPEAFNEVALRCLSSD